MVTWSPSTSVKLDLGSRATPKIVVPSLGAIMAVAADFFDQGPISRTIQRETDRLPALAQVVIDNRDGERLVLHIAVGPTQRPGNGV